MIHIDKEPVIKVGILLGRQIVFELYGDYKTGGFKNFLSGRFIAELIDNKIICRKGSEKIEVGIGGFAGADLRVDENSSGPAPVH